MILIVNKSKREAERTSDILFFMGIASYGATFAEALSEISEKYSAVLIFSDDSYDSVYELSLRLKSYCSSVPIFVSQAFIATDCGYFDGYFDTKKSIPIILKHISHDIDSESDRLPGAYRLMGLDASPSILSTKYFDTPIPFTRTENMILRVLIRHYPLPLSTEDVLKYAFRKSNCPEIASVRTHISVMNKKFRIITGRNLIEMHDGCEGYIIMTPEYLEKSIRHSC